MSATDTWCMPASSCLQCRGASAIWFVNQRWHLTSSTLISVWQRCTPGLWSTMQHMMLCDWRWIPTKAERQWLAREDSRVAIATCSSTMFSRMSLPTIYCGGIWSPGATERCNGSLGLRDEDDDAEGWLMSKEAQLMLTNLRDAFIGQSRSPNAVHSIYYV